MSDEFTSLEDFGVDTNNVEEIVSEGNLVGKGEIIELKESTNKDYFGNSDFDEKDIVVLVVELVEVKPSFSDEFVDKVEKEEITFEDTFSLPESESSWANPQFQLRKFRETYGKLPEKGMSVKVIMDDNGYYEIEIEGGFE